MMALRSAKRSVHFIPIDQTFWLFSFVKLMSVSFLSLIPVKYIIVDLI